MYIFKSCATIWQDFQHPKIRCWHTQLNVCEKEEFQCFLYLIQIFASHIGNMLTHAQGYNPWDAFSLPGLHSHHIGSVGFAWLAGDYCPAGYFIWIFPPFYNRTVVWHRSHPRTPPRLLLGVGGLVLFGYVVHPRIVLCWRSAGQCLRSAIA